MSLVVSVSSVGGTTWRFPVKLKVVEPKPDDVIKITGCEIGSSSMVSFDLYSTDEQEIRFTSGFLEGSDPEFQIEPAGGFLTAEGTRFTITYRPKIYGKRPTARLVINTSEKTVRNDFKTIRALLIF